MIFTYCALCNKPLYDSGEPPFVGINIRNFTCCYHMFSEFVLSFNLPSGELAWVRYEWSDQYLGYVNLCSGPDSTILYLENEYIELSNTYYDWNWFDAFELQDQIKLALAYA